MMLKKEKTLFSILDGSPFFTELSIKEKEGLINELLRSYPHLISNGNGDTEVGYEASWFSNQIY